MATVNLASVFGIVLNCQNKEPAHMQLVDIYKLKATCTTVADAADSVRMVVRHSALKLAIVYQEFAPSPHMYAGDIYRLQWACKDLDYAAKRWVIRRISSCKDVAARRAMRERRLGGVIAFDSAGRSLPRDRDEFFLEFGSQRQRQAAHAALEYWGAR